MGEADLLWKGEGMGDARREEEALGGSKVVDSSRSSRPDIRRLVRGRSVEAEEWAELARALLWLMSLSRSVLYTNSGRWCAAAAEELVVVEYMYPVPGAAAVFAGGVKVKLSQLFRQPAAGLCGHAPTAGGDIRLIASIPQYCEVQLSQPAAVCMCIDRVYRENAGAGQMRTVGVD